MDMNHMSMSSADNNATTMTMPMTFSISTTTPLFTTSWTPTSTGQYAGTCIFLIVFAAMYRALLSVRFNFSDILLASFKRAGDDQMVMYAADDDTKRSHRRRPWRAGEAVLLGVVDVVIGAVSYLLMIAVMTMNVGYFLSVLGGIFVGSVAFGHFMAPRSAAH